MKILAIDTSTLTGSVALLEDEKVLGEITLSVSVQHSERLMPAIQRLFEDTNVGARFTRPRGALTAPLHDIDLIAVAHGPGSFTGLRIGVAAAQGLSLALGKPAVGVSSLEGLAMNGFFFPGLIVPLLDARRGEVYAAIYQSKGGRLEIVGAERAVPPQQFVEELKRYGESPLLLLGPGSVYPIFATLGKEIASPAFNTPRAVHLGALAAREFMSKAYRPPLPQYLRSAHVCFPTSLFGS